MRFAGTSRREAALDNHDLTRIATLLPDTQQRRLVQILQFTLPVSTLEAGCLTITVPPQSILVLAPQEPALGGYSRYKRI